MKTNLLKIADLAQGKITAGSPEMVITGFSSVGEAEAGDVTFLGNSRYLPALAKSRASAVIAETDFKGAPKGMAVIQTKNPTLAFSAIVNEFGPQPLSFKAEVHASAVISASAKFDLEKVCIGPHVVVEDGVEIGDGTTIRAGSYIGRGSRIGTDCFIHANVSIQHLCVLGNRVIIHSGSVIGADGFGYEKSGGKLVKIEQVGIVQIDDDVEIGACTSIDRARFGRTWIGKGTKIDNHVQIGHNAVIGQHCIIVALSGLAGSCRIGSNTTLAAMVGVAGHVEIGENVVCLGRTGVTKSIPKPGAYTGFPVTPLMEGRKVMAAQARLPELLKRVKKLEAQLAKLQPSDNADP